MTVLEGSDVSELSEPLEPADNGPRPAPPSRPQKPGRRSQRFLGPVGHVRSASGCCSPIFSPTGGWVIGMTA
jgi:hypothetical protein